MLNPPNPPSRLPPVPTTNEVCPQCGDFVDYLENSTGWCMKCSQLDCNGASQNGAPDPLRDQLENYLQRNANHLEHFLSQGLSLNQAIDEISKAVQPTCIVCGKAMRRAKRNAVICRRTDKCKAAARRYEYLYTKREKSKAEALAQIMNELAA